jgi:hypothetical protein
MFTFCIALMLFAAQAGEEINSSDRTNAAISQDTATRAERQQSAAPVRKGKDLEAATHAALRRWAKVGKANAPAAAREFIAIFNELKQDTSLSPSKRQQLGGQVRSRLLRLVALLPKSGGVNRGSDLPAHVGDAQDQPQVLGQLGGGGNPVAGMGNPALGGQAGGLSGNSMNNTPPDAGEDLVALIQKTIAPSSWDINGGPGSIQYWRPGHALVIRASEDVHEQIGGVMGQLHQAQ